MTERRTAWATMDDRGLRDKLNSMIEQSARWDALLDKADAWEDRLEKLEADFTQFLQRLNGFILGMKVVAAIVAVVGTALCSSVLWYAQKRDQVLTETHTLASNAVPSSELRRLSDAVTQLTLSAQALTTAATYKDRESTDLKARIERLEQKTDRGQK